MKDLLSLFSFIFIFYFQAKAVDLSADLSLKNISSEVVINHAVAPINHLKKSIELGYFSGEKELEFSLANKSTRKIEPVLFFDSITGSIELYEKQTDQALKRIDSFGSSVPDSQKSEKLLFQTMFSAKMIVLGPNETKNLVLKVRSRHNFNSKLYVGSLQDLKEFENEKRLFFYIYLGSILSLIIYNLFIYLYLKDQNYLRYCSFSFFFLLALSVMRGYLDLLIQFNSFTFSHYLIVFSALALLSATRFTYFFLEIYKNKKWIKNLFKFYSCVSMLLIAVGLTGIEDQFPQIFGFGIDLSIVTANIFFIYCAIINFKKTSSARFYLISWLFVVVSLIIWFGMTFGFLPQNFLTQNSLLFANIAQMLTLSVALAFRIHTLTKEKHIAEEKAFQKDRYQRLVRVLSHDIANSLTVIYVNTERLLAHFFKTEEQVLQVHHKIYFAAQNIKNILTHVREQEVFHSNHFNKMKIDLFKVKPIFEAAKLIFEDQLFAKSIALEIKIDDEDVIKADKVSFLNNIVNNIISNSIKFSNEHSVIQIRSEKDLQHIHFYFIDSGVGIEAHLINEIFFSKKIHSSVGTNAETGSGFGATLIRDYVELFDGQIQITSVTQATDSQNSGTRIKISFPLVG